ncbi:MAG TPA: ATP-binding cassette domain-containing protein [Actinopolymorphaceae bacterium]
MTRVCPAVQAEGWGYRHAGRSTWALRGLDLTVQPGERGRLAGPSGVGKSTLLGAVAGLLDTEHSGEETGRLSVFGASPRQARGSVGMVFQDPETQLVMARCGDDVAFGLENHAVPTDEIWRRVRAALDLVDFPYDLDHSTAALSGGEKQRLVIAGILALRPSILLLDEPTANLDRESAALVRETVTRAVHETGATLFVVEHRVEDWLDIVDRVVVLDRSDGVRADGDPAKVFDAEGETLAAQGIWVPGIELPTARRGDDSPPPVPVLTAREVSYGYPRADRLAVDQVTTSLASGETLAITGSNGSGKSTLAMLLSGLLKPTAGAVRTTSSDRPMHRFGAGRLVEEIGVVFQDPEHQFLTGSVRDELALGPRLAGRPPAEVAARVDELLTRLRLDHLADANPFTLSGGEKRRLSVATALAAGPRALVLDEPTFGQDRRTWIELLELLARLRDDGHAICCISHDPDFIDALADRTLELVAGVAREEQNQRETP